MLQDIRDSSGSWGFLLVRNIVFEPNEFTSLHRRAEAIAEMPQEAKQLLHIEKNPLRSAIFTFSSECSLYLWHDHLLAMLPFSLSLSLKFNRGTQTRVGAGGPRSVAARRGAFPI